MFIIAFVGKTSLGFLALEQRLPKKLLRHHNEQKTYNYSKLARWGCTAYIKHSKVFLNSRSQLMLLPL
ncbi:unnamed protein product, partial [Vitis vinifera]|uniref:Uncharacterized protein n=1 Tax=Vitis vinifera TaxID=29760 RepID=D7U9E8_VITVI